MNKRESVGLKYCSDSKAFIESSHDTDDIYEKNDEYNPNKKRKVLIISDDMIDDMFNTKQISPIVTELFMRVRTMYISVVFIT